MDDNFLAGLWAWGWFVAAGGLFLLTFILIIQSIHHLFHLKKLLYVILSRLFSA